MKELLVNQDAFIEWYFDYDMRKTFFSDNSILENLKSNGKFSITIQQLLDEVCYLPESVIIEGQNPILIECGEVDTSQYKSFKLVKI